MSIVEGKKWRGWQLLFVLLLAAWLIIGISSAAAPVASFTPNSATGPYPYTVQFNDTSTNTPDGWNWSYGDDDTFYPSNGTFKTGTPTSFSDDAVSDQSANYTTVSGTAISWDAGQYYSLVANTDSKYRLNYSQYASGQYLYNFTLPASANDGDYINARVASGSALTTGYGIGVIRSGGVWNVSSVVNTAVTDSKITVSGLADGDQVHVKIQYDPSRAYVNGTVYETTDTTPQVTIYSSLYTYGYSGIVVHSASGSKSYNLNSIQIQAGSLAGISNVPAIENGWTFSTDFTTNESGRWIKRAGTSTVTYGGLGGKLSIVGGDGDTNVYLVPLSISRSNTTTFFVDVKCVDTHAEYKSAFIHFGYDPVTANQYRVELNFYSDTVKLTKYTVSGGSATLFTTGLTLNDNVNYPVKITWSQAGVISVYVDSGSGYTLVNSATDTTISNGTVDLRGYQVTGANLNMDFDNLSITGTRVYNAPATTTSTLQNPQHTYYTVGNYSVALQASNVDGSNVSTQISFVNVTSPIAPVAAFSGTPTSGFAPLSVQFTDESANYPTAWNWSFGDDDTFYPSNGTFKTGTPTSFSDDALSDKSANYTTVTGTAISWDAGQYYSLVANTDSKYRLNYSQYASGQYTYNFTLPASANDGDYINARVASGSDLATGYGVGVIRSGGVWNISSVINTAVTDSKVTVAGLSDGDQAHVKILYDPSRAYFSGTVYETTDPGTPQATIYNYVFNYGYSGIVVHSASGSKTFRLYSIEIRANCLIGETNVPATETGFVHSEDMSVNSIGRWYIPTHVSITGGYLVFDSTATKRSATLQPSKTTASTISFTFKPDKNGGAASRLWILFRRSSNIQNGDPELGTDNRYGIQIQASSNAVRFRKYTGSTSLGTQLSSGYSITDAADNTATITTSGTLGAVVISVTINGVTKTWTDTDTTVDLTGEGYVGLGKEDLSDIESVKNVIISGTRSYNAPVTTTSTAQNPQHTYYTVGNYSVALQASNGDGLNTSTQVSFVNVTSPIAPVAAFSGTPTSGFAPLTVKFTDESTNVPTSWLWDFGDGDSTNSTVQNPVHTYLTNGTKTVSLNASNAQGFDIETKTAYIDVIVPVPVANLSLLNYIGKVPFTTRLTDTSVNTSTYPLTYYTDLGDGNSSTEKDLYYTWNATGTFIINHSVTNGISTSYYKVNVTVIPATTIEPISSFQGGPTTGPVQLRVFFTDVSSNTPTSWNWSFGDGLYSELQNPQHQYTSSGFKTVSLTATNSAGSNITVRAKFVKVS